MAEHKISTIVYAQGFVEGFIEAETEPIEIGEDWTDETQQDAAEQNEYRKEVLSTWKVLSEGLDQLRRENDSLRNKISLVDSAMKTPT